MKLWSLLLGIFLCAGAVIAIISLYNSSVSGTMEKMGLVGSDFSVSVTEEKLDRAYLTTLSNIKCGLASRVSGAIKYMFSRDDQQGEMSFALGEQRIKCGGSMIASGKVEEGTYEVMKGMGYLETGYNFVSERGEIDLGVCRSLLGNTSDETISKLVEGTNGRVKELIVKRWVELDEVREEAERVCH